MYGILAIHEVYIQLDCVGMARMPYPPTKKLLQMFCRSFFMSLYVLYRLSGTSFTAFRAPP